MTEFIGDGLRLLRKLFPAVVVLAVLDVAIVATIVHAGTSDSGVFLRSVLRDLLWCIGALVVAALPVAFALALLRRPLPALREETGVFLGALGLALVLSAVGLHHHLKADQVEGAERLLWFGGLAVWLAIVAVVGAIASRRGPRRGLLGHPALGAALVATVPLYLNVSVDSTDQAVHLAPTSMPTPSIEHDRPKLIVLLTLDTTRFDAVGYSRSGRTHTPALDRLASEGAAFVQATTPTPLTLPSHTSMMTGLAPSAHGVVVNGMRIPRQVPMLAEQLREAGWRTGAFVAAPVVSRETGLSRGFETYDGVLSGSTLPSRPLAVTRILGRLGLYRFPTERPGEVITSRALRWLEMADPRPTFLWVHYFDTHWPYAPRRAPASPSGDKLAQASPEQVSRYAAGVGTPDWFTERMRELYEQEVEELDGFVSDLLDGLDELGRLDSSLLIAIADHGESFEAPSLFGHADILNEATLRIPLIVRWPGRVPAGLRPERLVTVEDVHPTILDAAGFAERADGTYAVSLLRLIDDPEGSASREFTVHETYPHPMASSGEKLLAVRSATDKLVRSPDQGREAFYRLSDPFHDGPDRIAEADNADRLREFQALLDAVGEGSVRGEMIDDASTVEMLRSLGYVD